MEAAAATFLHRQVISHNKAEARKEVVAALDNNHLLHMGHHNKADLVVVLVQVLVLVPVIHPADQAAKVSLIELILLFYH